MLSIGQNIQMEPVAETNEKETTRLFETEVAICDEENQTFSIKNTANAEELFEIGARFIVTIIEEEGEVYQFETNVLKQEKDHPSYVVFQLPDHVKRVQRRAFIRVDITVPVTIELEKTIEATTSNLSGGGMSVTLPIHEEIAVDDTFNGYIYLQEGKKTPVVSRVVRLEKNAEAQTQNVYVTFTDIDDADRREIVYYCFQKQVTEYRKQR